MVFLFFLVAMAAGLLPAMPAFPPDDGQYVEDPYGDEHPLFPQDDFWDVSLNCSSPPPAFGFANCSLSMHSSRLSFSFLSARVKLHGGDPVRPSFQVRVSLPGIAPSTRGFILKNTFAADPTLLRERLSSRFMRASGLKVQRECFARLALAGWSPPLLLVVMEELVDAQFAVSRYGSPAGAGLWKVGGNHESQPVSPENAWAAGPEGAAELAAATAAVARGAGQAPLLWDNWARAMAAIAATADYDGLAGAHNYYLADPGGEFDIVVYDMDWTLGAGSLRWVRNTTAWPVMFCTAFKMRSPWCVDVQNALGEAYPRAILNLIATYDPMPDLMALEAQAEVLRGPSNSTKVIAQFIQQRNEFLKENIKL